MMVQVKNEQQRWELLEGQGSSIQRGERARLGADIRGKLQNLKLETEKLQRELEGLSDNSSENDVTRKSITQLRDELALVAADVREMLTRSKGTAPLSSPLRTFVETPISSPSGSFVSLPGDAVARAGKGAEMQPVINHRSMLLSQQQMMRDFDEPLAALEGTVNNLQQVGRHINREISQQNQMLDHTNESTERVAGRLTRVRSLMIRFSEQDKNRWLLCLITLIVAVLLVIFIYVVAV